MLSGFLQVCKTSDIMPTFVNNCSRASVFFPKNQENDKERRMNAKSMKVAWTRVSTRVEDMLIKTQFHWQIRSKAEATSEC